MKLDVLGIVQKIGMVIFRQQEAPWERKPPPRLVWGAGNYIQTLNSLANCYLCPYSENVRNIYPSIHPSIHHSVMLP